MFNKNFFNTALSENNKYHSHISDAHAFEIIQSSSDELNTVKYNNNFQFNKLSIKEIGQVYI